MSFFQRLFVRLFPRKWVENMEAHSRSWMVRCPCGFTQSVWDMGGIRWKAAGRPRWYLKCRKCGERSWHTVFREPQPPSADEIRPDPHG
ncbi:MAG TPA: hypothetical protein VG796_02305 [Verrucomicrobiales bacterium]|nr:hypothetical protein [Verrucomicrobiales bacterium]